MSRYPAGRPKRAEIDGQIWCSRGRHFQPLEDFYTHSTHPIRKDGSRAPTAWCKGCMKAYLAERRKKQRLERRIAAAQQDNVLSPWPEPPCPISGEVCVAGADGLCPCERVIRRGDER